MRRPCSPAAGAAAAVAFLAIIAGRWRGAGAARPTRQGLPDNPDEEPEHKFGHLLIRQEPTDMDPADFDTHFVVSDPEQDDIEKMTVSGIKSGVSEEVQVINGSRSSHKSTSLEADVLEGKLLQDASPQVACCCKKGPCSKKPNSKGARGFKPREVETKKGKTMCCKERAGERCDNIGGYTKAGDSSRCLPELDEATQGKVRLCRVEARIGGHTFIEFGDGGCLKLLKPDGRYNTKVSAGAEALYRRRDCPFPGPGRELQVRRQLLYNFHVAKQASYADIMHTCSPWAGQTKVDKPEEWEKDSSLLTAILTDDWYFLDQKPLRWHLQSENVDQDDFICETLRLLPLMWSRVGFLPNGLTLDNMYHEGGYPRSYKGHVTRHVYPDDFICHNYRELSSHESLLARRVLRALLPTWAPHVFVETARAASVEYLKRKLSRAQDIRYDVEVGRECRRGGDVEFVQQPLRSLQNKDVMLRDAGTCTKSWPCAYTSTECAAYHDKDKCRCGCYKAICMTWVDDFVLAMSSARAIDDCTKFVAELPLPGAQQPDLFREDQA